MFWCAENNGRMVRSTASVPTELSERVKLGLYGLAILATVAAAYHAGTSGDWVPLMAASVVTGTLVALTSSE